MRWLHLIVVATLVTAAVDVYKIKFESTVQAERVAKLRAEISRERDAIGALRAQWAKLDNPSRIQVLAQRHLPLKPVDPAQIDALDRLPERPPASAPMQDAAAAVADSQDTELPSGSTPVESVPAVSGSGGTR
jgi:hypothetical protein